MKYHIYRFADSSWKSSFRDLLLQVLGSVTFVVAVGGGARFVPI